MRYNITGNDKEIWHSSANYNTGRQLWRVYDNLRGVDYFCRNNICVQTSFADNNLREEMYSCKLVNK